MFQSEILTTERILLQKTIGTLDMLQNRASLLQISSFSIRFPFDSTFNEVLEKVYFDIKKYFLIKFSISFQFVNIRKWLKRLHYYDDGMSSAYISKVPRHKVSNEVWTDLSIKINVRLLIYLIYILFFVFLRILN